MIAFLRNLATHDLGLKLFALALAVLIWTTVHAIIEDGGGGSPSSFQPRRTFRELPVWVTSTANEGRAVRVNPDKVDVTVRGRKEILEQLTPKDIRVTVILTDIAEARDLRQHVDVNTPPGVTLVRVAPADVKVVVLPK